MEFDTRRLLIKKFIPEYISLMYETWGTDDDVGKYMVGFRTDWNLDEFSDYIMKTYKDEHHTRCVIQNKKDNKIIGNISLYQEDSRSKSINVWLIKEVWNKGYGTEVLAGILKYFKKSNIECLYATCDHRNLGAIRMLEKNNFECIDKIEASREDINGELGDELLYELELKK